MVGTPHSYLAHRRSQFRQAVSAFPVVETTSTTDGGSAASISVTLPSGHSSGDLIIIFLDSRGSITAAWSQTAGTTGWTELSEFRSSAVYYKKIGASEPDPSFDCDETDNVGAIAYRISGAADPATQAPEVSTANGSGTTPDPASVAGTGGSKKYLFLAQININGQRSVSSDPTNYSNRQELNVGTGGGGTTLASTERQLEAASDDPGTYTISGSSAWNTFTVVVHPE